MPSVLTYRSGGRAPVQAVIDARGPELAQFGKEDLRQILSAALKVGAEYYRVVCVPKLFTGRVYRAPFNYHVGSEYAKRKQKLGLPPLVGPDNAKQPLHLRDAALYQSYSEVVAKGSRGTWEMIIRIPGVDHVNFNHMVMDTLRAVPAEWMEEVSQVVAKALEGLLSGAVAGGRAGGPARQLTGDTRAMIGGRRGRPSARKVAGHG